MTLEWAASLAVLAALSCCAGHRPAIPADAAVTTPASWRTETAGEGQLDLDWWKSFGDPELTALVETVQANNVDLRLAALRVTQAEAEVRLAHAQRLPDVVAGGTHLRDRDVNPGFGVPEQQDASEILLSVSYDLDLFGRLKSANRAAAAALLATRAARDDARLTVTAQAVRMYVDLMTLDERLTILRRTLDARAKSLQVTTRRARAGYASQLDLAQAEADYRATEAMIPGAELSITRTEDAVRVLLGQNPGDVQRGQSLADLSVPAIPAGLPSALLRRRPDLFEAEEELVATDHSLDAARAAFMPDFQLSGSIGDVWSTLIRDAPIEIFSLAGSALAPIFDSGRLRAQEDAVAAQRDAAAFVYRKVALRAFAQVEDALAATRRIGEQRAALEAQRDQLHRTLQLATARYRAGYASFLDQLDAERGLLAAELAVAQARGDQLAAIISLYLALGGGWDRASLAADAPDGTVR
jgi:outer membrane protein, multidrug efflux system